MPGSQLSAGKGDRLGRIVSYFVKLKGVGLIDEFDIIFLQFLAETIPCSIFKYMYFNLAFPSDVSVFHFYKVFHSLRLAILSQAAVVCIVSLHISPFQNILHDQLMGRHQN